jgi:hypothetical protein
LLMQVEAQIRGGRLAPHVPIQLQSADRSPGELR